MTKNKTNSKDKKSLSRDKNKNNIINNSEEDYNCLKEEINSSLHSIGISNIN